MTILAQSGVFAWALQYTKYGTGTTAAAQAYARAIYTVLPVAAETITIGAQVYTWRAAPTTIAGEVKIGTTIAISLANLAAAVITGAGSGTLYGSLTVINAAATAVAAYNTLFLTAIASTSAGNSIALTTAVGSVTLVPFTGGLTVGPYDITIQTYYQHRSNDVDYDIVQDSRIFPLEVGSVITPTGAYKAGVYAAGGATLLPRLQDTFGQLLLALLGKATVQINTPVSGAHTHTFAVDPLNIATVPWVIIRRMIPGRGIVRPQGLVGVDNILAQMQIMIPQNDLVSVRCDFAGRVPIMDLFPDAWLWANAYEGADRVPVSCIGDFKLPTIFTANLPVTSVVVTVVNNITTPRQEQIVGAYNPDDFVIISRVMTVRFVYKWSDPGLYNELYTNSLVGTAWSPTPFITNFDGGVNYAFQADISATANVTGATPYSMKIRAGTVAWQPNGPVVLRGGGIIAMEILGTVLDPSATGNGAPYAEVQMVNGRSTVYSAPPAP